jgi:glycosyltransferase involved in cell wall biosynthesis
MLELPTISVVTPSFNAAATIEETLRSVREQDYPHLEHVVVDGGSTDGTVAILERADDVRFVSEPDRGLSHAMNKGVAMATGDIVGWLNADDTYLPGAVRAIGEAFAARPEAEWATGRCLIVDGAGREIRKGATAYKNFFLRRYSHSLYLTQNFISAPATFVRREAYQRHPFREDYAMSMDYDVFLQLAQAGDPIVLDRDVACFRMMEGTLSMSSFERQFAEHAEQARAHGAGHPIPVAINQAVSRLIVLVYHALRAARQLRARIVASGASNRSTSSQ